MISADATLFGCLPYLIAMFISVCNNVIIKKTMIESGIPAWEVVAVYQGAIFAVILPLMIKKRFHFFRKSALKLNLIRNVLYAFSFWLIYSSLVSMPVNVNVGIQFLTPILASVFAVVFLKEKGSISTWIALFICICGAVVIKGKTEIHFSKDSIAYLFLIAFVVIRASGSILNRKLASTFQTTDLVFYSHTIIFFTALTAVLITRDAVPLSLNTFLTLCVCGFCNCMEYLLIFRSYKHCNVSTLQPLEFSKMVYSIVLSYLVLNELPNFYQIIGCFIIAIGVFILAHKKK